MEYQPDNIRRVSRREFVKKSTELAKLFVGISLLGNNLISPDISFAASPYIHNPLKSKRLSVLSDVQQALDQSLVFSRVGSHWMHQDRVLYGNPSCDIELIYVKNSPPGFDAESVRNRVKTIFKKGDVDIWLRLDWQPGQTLPPAGDTKALVEYTQMAANIAKDDILSTVAGIICGNEPNHKTEWRVSEIPLTPRWVAKCVYEDTFQAVKKQSSDMLVIAPAVSVFTSDLTGSKLYLPPDDRVLLSPWERYMYEMAYFCYDKGLPAAEVIFAMHTYSRVGPDGNLNGASKEPASGVREEAYGAYFGTQSLDDLLYAAAQSNGGFLPPIIVSEWNCFADAAPNISYPKGLLKEVVKYILSKPNVLGFANFVDEDRSGVWNNTAMSYSKKTKQSKIVEGDDGEEEVWYYEDRVQAKLDDWNRDFDDLLRIGLGMYNV